MLWKDAKSSMAAEEEEATNSSPCSRSSFLFFFVLSALSFFSYLSLSLALSLSRAFVSSPRDLSRCALLAVRWRSSGKFGRLVARLTFYKSIIEKHVWKVRGENHFFLKRGGKKLFGKKRFCPALVSRAWKRHQRSSALPFHYGKSWRHFAVWSLDVLRQESTRRASMVQKSYHSCLSMHVKLLSNSPRHPPKGYQAHWYSPFWDPENLTKGSGFKPKLCVHSQVKQLLSALCQVCQRNKSIKSVATIFSCFLTLPAGYHGKLSLIKKRKKEARCLGFRV